MPKSDKAEKGGTVGGAGATKTALYRAYRPFAFSDVVGQDHIVKVLEGSINSERVSHAYLFAGSRGTGKTSVARIFARALGTSENDIYEIDAASNRGIDDIRAIRDGVAVLPLESRYKVYIIDEAHMLTKEAFNALLKTLEEPPAHAIFILATTELDKVPETIVSRCQSFSFKKPSREILREVATAVAKKEGFTLEAGVADLIAMMGDGSFRDMLGTLQKVIGAGDAPEKGTKGKITLAEAELVIGAPRNSLVNDFVVAFASKNSEKALVVIEQVAAMSIDMKMFVALVIEKMRFALLHKISKESAKSMTEHMSPEDVSFLSGITPSSTMITILLRVYDETGRAYIQSLPLELAVLNLSTTQQ
jgi:DNA polymerase-3 subunit gamma/tau